MKINSFDLDLKAARTYRESRTEEVTREVLFSDIMDAGKTSVSQFRESVFFQTNTLTAAGVSGRQVISDQWLESVTLQGQEAFSLTGRFRFELEKMRQIIKALLGQMGGMTRGAGLNLDRAGDIFLAPRLGTAWEMTETRSFRYEESEQTLVSAGGRVMTGDNREIDFSFEFSMERSFLREDCFSVSQTGYALLDPLIINTDMAAPNLSGSRFSFDLDLDGDNEDLPLPGPGTGFLCLDLNGDGEINDGRELFGPSTGDGFAELAAYDLDHNDWIDENDPVFDRLTLWEQAESGGMELTRIKDAGIGAIYLAGVESPFDLTSDENELLGRISKSSIALTEAGGVLPVQEMEYKV